MRSEEDEETEGRRKGVTALRRDGVKVKKKKFLAELRRGKPLSYAEK